MNLHQEFSEAYPAPHPKVLRKEAQQSSSGAWDSAKAAHGGPKGAEFHTFIEQERQASKVLVTQRRGAAALERFLPRVPKQKFEFDGVSTSSADKNPSGSSASSSAAIHKENKSECSKAAAADVIITQPFSIVGPDEENEWVISEPDGEGPGAHQKRKNHPLPATSDEEDHLEGNFSELAQKRKYASPAQTAAMEAIASYDRIIAKLTEARDRGLATDLSLGELERAKKSKTQELAKLRKLQCVQKAQQKYRKKTRELVLAARTPRQSSTNEVQKGAGRPRNPQDKEIIAAISNIAIHGSVAEDRCRSEIIRTCRTLDDLHRELLKQGFDLSRSATYLRLLPRCATSTEGKRHEQTAPVKLIRAAEDLHKAHPDAQFCTASFRNVESLASLLQEDVAFLSQDNKARIPLGITAANKQAPLLMRMDHRVKLPDHDWVMAERHKLIPSVYAGIRIAEKYPIGQPDAVSYSGPTYVAIRSGKHTSSTAASHGKDLARLLNLESFDSVMKSSSGDVKPVVIITVGGGPDENPRYRKVIMEAVRFFQAKNLDFMVVVTNPPGRNAYNRAERRMAPLSRALSGLVLKHDHYGSHLDSHLRTIDVDLEKKNFEFAGRTLADIWSDLLIDKESVVAEYIVPEADEERNDLGDPGTNWYANHVRESQYLLQISKCQDSNCCSELRSKLRIFLPHGFLPPPLLLKKGLAAAQPLAQNCHFAPLFVQLASTIQFPGGSLDNVPFDFYCPSQQSQIEGRCCSVCRLYFASKEAMRGHKRNIHSVGSLIDSQDRDGPPNVPGHRSIRLAHQAGEVLTQHQDEMGAPLDVEWLPEDNLDVPPAGDDNYSDDDIPLIHLIKNIPDWSACPWTEEK